MKPSRRNTAKAQAKAEQRQGKKPVVTKYSAKVQRQIKEVGE